MRTTKSNRLVFVVLGIGLWFFLARSEIQAQNSEPLYNGKPESHWINSLRSFPFANGGTPYIALLGSNEVPILLKAVEMQSGSNAPAIRTNAAILLATKGDPAILLPLARKHRDSRVRSIALSGLTFIKDEAVTVAMVEALTDKDPAVRRAAVGGLGLTERKKIPEQLSALVKCLQDADPDVRCSAAGIMCNYYPHLPGQDQTAVAEAAFAEIKRAVNHPDPVVKAAAMKAVNEGHPQIALRKFTHELAIALDELHGSFWRATVKIVDERGLPLEAADVSVTYFIPAAPGGHAGSSWRKIDGRTDSDGVFTASHKDGSRQLSFNSEKTGYYSTRGVLEKTGYSSMPGVLQFILPDPRDPRDPKELASNFDLNVTLVLKKMLRPIPMYVNQVNITQEEKPALDKPLGFDLTIGDWVSPYGKGTKLHMYFTWQIDQDTNGVPARNGINRRSKTGWEEKLTISFPNPGDGIQEFELPGRFGNRSEGDVGSELRSPQEAPESGYQQQLIKLRSWRPGRPGTNTYDHLHKNYFLRVNTVLDETGKIKTAQYGKIYGDFKPAFSTYLNPEPNSRGIEFDLKHNLGRGGTGSYMRY